jgi:hypothetical protein
MTYNKFDVVILAGKCPMTAYAINATSFVPLRTGDEASTLGFVNGDSRFWHGRLSGKVGKMSSSNGMIHESEYLFEGVSQIAGMSGGATLNGAGYTGMVHTKESTLQMASVIPASMLFKEIDNFNDDQRRYLTTLAQCPHVTVMNVPTY